MSHPLTHQSIPQATQQKTTQKRVPKRVAPENSKSSKQYFGTDGIRGRVGSYPIVPEFMLKLGWAVGKVLGGSHVGRNPEVLIGKDTRISGYLFESALESGLSAAGINVRLLGPMPTPAVAYLTRTFRAQAGIVISASHNPHQDNGVKFFSGEGQKLDDRIELRIEQVMASQMKLCESADLGKAKRVEDAQGRYIEFCKSTFDRDLSLKGVHMVIDCAHGATYQVAPQVFEELGARVTCIGVSPDGLNINQNVGSTALDALKANVIAKQADLGIAFDGDGDRVIMVDHQGNTVDGDELLYIIALSRKARGLLEGGVVGTLMSNFGLELALASAQIPFLRARVGDRYVMEQLVKHNWTIGGESSGHIICLDQTTTGDGLVSALQVLAALVRSGKSLTDQLGQMVKAPQKMINVPLKPGADPMNHPKVSQAVQEAEQRLQKTGRVLLRPSGTEPLIRVMVEGKDPDLVNELATRIANVLDACI